MRIVAALIVIGAVAVFGGAAATVAAGQTSGSFSSCPKGSRPAVIAGSFKCLKVGQSCKARYQGSYRKYGFHCVNGRLRKGTGVSHTPPPPAPSPPPPEPTPAAIDGHYKGVTSQNETFEFDIVSGGLVFRGLKTGQINEGCTPPGHIYGNYFDWPDYAVAVTLAGDFTIDTDLRGSVGDSQSTGHLTIRGHMNGQAGSGSLELKNAFTSNGVAYTCGSGLQTWTVTKTG
jgi:hypothetical protein